MKRFFICLIAASLLACVSGCEQQQMVEGGINVYYISSSGDNLVYESTAFPSEYSTDTVDNVIERLSEPNNTDGDEKSPVLKNDIKIDSYKYNKKNGEFDIDLSGDYGSLANTDKLLLTAGLTLTFEQMDEISDVYITIQDEPLLDSNGDDLGVLDSDDFVIHSGNEINIYTSTNMELYFLNSEGDALESETRTVYYNSNVPLEQVVLEELIKGPLDTDHRAALASTVGFLSVTVQEDVCYVNFDEGTPSAMAMYDSSLALESIVQSINAVCDVDKVQFSINGDTLAKFSDGTSIDYIYEAD